MNQKSCFHCGEEVIGKGIIFDDKSFCCNGCKSVYQLLSTNNLDSFYSFEKNAGNRPSESNEHKYAFLDVESIRNKFIDFEDEKSIHVTLYLPKIHCSSCIFLLENLANLNSNIQSCQVNFTKRLATIVFNKSKLRLSELSFLLDKIGYSPNFGSQKVQKRKQNFKYLYKLGVAGFAFGSIMLWSFPEYLGIEKDSYEIRSFTSYLSLLVSIPVLFYSANEYLISAFKALKFRSINLDVPISIGILALYIQSASSILLNDGPGYMDSFAGFIFFLLIGKWFQNKTYESLSFERDYTSYFPVAVIRKNKEGEEFVEIDQINVGDHIIIRNGEVIPCDVQLISKSTQIDYSFVTGEANPVTKKSNEFIFAGGKQIGNISEFEVLKESNRSHLTQLWNEASSKKENIQENKSDRISVFFLIGVLIIAMTSGVFWYLDSPSRATEIVVSVLIVACPCALALSKPFTYGNIMRLLGRKGLYLKNSSVIQKLNEIDTIVFDKTGTLTTGSSDHIEYHGEKLTEIDKKAILLLTNSSTHPLSRVITSNYKDIIEIGEDEITEFKELAGGGLSGKLKENVYKIGSPTFVGFPEKDQEKETTTHISANGKYLGRFIFDSELRPEVEKMLGELQKNYAVHILSGDKNKDLKLMESIISHKENIFFNQSPQDKLLYIEKLQSNNKYVLMVGDGLNDAGALEKSHVGIAVSEDIFRFSPSSDAIIKATMMGIFDKLLNISNYSKTVLSICYTFSILYNVLGLTFAISGNLTPLIAAILMPLSSISIVLISTLSSSLKR